MPGLILDNGVLLQVCSDIRSELIELNVLKANQECKDSWSSRMGISGYFHNQNA
jgi:hypothetical protein